MKFINQCKVSRLFRVRLPITVKKRSKISSHLKTLRNKVVKETVMNNKTKHKSISAPWRTKRTYSTLRSMEISGTSSDRPPLTPNPQRSIFGF